MDNKSIAHTRWNCTYHIVFIPKYRRKIMYGETRKDIVEIIKKLCEMKQVTLIKGSVCKDHIHMYLGIPPKLSISEVMAYIKGKSALMLFDRHPEYRQKLGSRNFWARGYYVSTVGNVNEETILKYIKEQEENDKLKN
jgi:putative transposase